MKKTIFIICCWCFTIFQSIAQENCPMDILHHKMIQTDPLYKSNFEKMEAQLHSQRFTKPQNYRQQNYTIPIVVHVMHLGEPEGLGSNISDSQIYEAIAGLNDRFSNAIGNGLDMEIEFCLASSDPQGSSTSGINRVDASIIPNYEEYGIGPYCDLAASETLVKDLSRWPVSDYYNIWVVHRIPREDCSQIWSGYAYYPYGGPKDGATMRAQRMNFSSSTLAHELGHGLNLRHTFHGDSDNTRCPNDSQCTVFGDRICDTPPHKRNDCGITNPCTTDGIWNNSRYNYMSYCNLPRSQARFTQGQKDYMMATLQVFPRVDLLTSTGCNNPSLGIQLSISHMSCDSLCDGSIKANVNSALPVSYHWDTQDTTQTISGLCAGTYTVSVTDAEGFTEIANATVSVNPTPSVSFNIPSNVRLVCKNSNSIFLTGAMPSGGSFSGPGVSLNLFYPQIAGVGKHVITYSFPNIPICAVIARDTITVEECVGINEMELMDLVSVEPNPVYSSLFMNWDPKAELHQVTLQDLSGRRIGVYDLPKGITSYEIDMSELPQGLYFLTLKGLAYKTVKVFKAGF